jgi:CDP-paratose 2-epimerase
MKILITGGCGFLGSNLTSRAIKLGYEVIVFDNLFREGSSYNLQWLKGLGLFEFCHGDIRNYNDIYGIVNKHKPDFVFHVAGQVAMTTSISNPRLDFEINTLGTHNLLESVRLCAPECGVIYSSTNKVYGDLEQYSYSETEKRYVCNEMPKGFDESVCLDFRSPYGCSKGAADQYVLDYSRVFELKTVVLRHSSMYGD